MSEFSFSELLGVADVAELSFSEPLSDAEMAELLKMKKKMKKLRRLTPAPTPPVGDSCPWNKETASRAVRKGELECLEWLHEHGCS